MRVVVTLVVFAAVGVMALMMAFGERAETEVTVPVVSVPRPKQMGRSLVVMLAADDEQGFLRHWRGVVSPEIPWTSEAIKDNFRRVQAAADWSVARIHSSRLAPRPDASTPSSPLVGGTILDLWVELTSGTERLRLGLLDIDRAPGEWRGRELFLRFQDREDEVLRLNPMAGW